MSIHIMEVVQFLLTFAEFFLCFLYLELFVNGAEINKRNLYRAILPCVGVAVMVICNRSFAFFSFLILIVQVCIIFLAAGLIYRKKSIWLFAFISFYNVQVAVLDFALTFLFTQKRMNREYINLYLHNLTVTRLAAFFLCRLLMGFAYFSLLRKLRRKGMAINLEPYSKVLLCISAFETAAMYYFMSIFSELKSFARVSAWVGMLTIGIAACCLLALYIRYSQENEKMHIIEIKNAMLEKRYRDMYEASMESGRGYHDFKNQLGIIYAYIKDRKNEEALAYIEKIRRPVLLLQEYTQTGNGALDLVLCDKLKQADDHGIKVTARLDRIGKVDVNDFDFYLIMANVLDNALEACGLVTEEKPWIDIILTRRGHIIFIEVKNSLQFPPKEEKGSLRTSKKDEKIHGYGLRSVELAVKKYNGCIEISYNQDTFDISLTLFADKKPSIDGHT